MLEADANTIPLERSRQERLAALRNKSTQVKQHREAGHGELREIVEEEFLKEVTSTKVSGSCSAESESLPLPVSTWKDSSQPEA